MFTSNTAVGDIHDVADDDDYSILWQLGEEIYDVEVLPAKGRNGLANALAMIFAGGDNYHTSGAKMQKNIDNLEARTDRDRAEFLRKRLPATLVMDRIIEDVRNGTFDPEAPITEDDRVSVGLPGDVALTVGNFVIHGVLSYSVSVAGNVYIRTVHTKF